MRGDCFESSDLAMTMQTPLHITDTSRLFRGVPRFHDMLRQMNLMRRKIPFFPEDPFKMASWAF